MKKSDTFLSLVFWVIAGAIFATGAVILNPRPDWDGGRNRTSVVQPDIPIAFEER